MVLAVEIIVCCLIFGIYRVIRIKRDPAYKISNMPEKLQKKVMHMRGYRNRNIRIMTDWEKFVKKLPTLIFWTIALVILTSIAGATSFSTGFVFALLIWMAGTRTCFFFPMAIFHRFIIPPWLAPDILTPKNFPPFAN